MQGTVSGSTIERGEYGKIIFEDNGGEDRGRLCGVQVYSKSNRSMHTGRSSRNLLCIIDLDL